MILQELTHFYERLLNNPDIDICEPGFSKENISFKIIINENGELVDKNHPIIDLRESDGKNLRPIKIKVPKFDGKRTSGIKPYFLWDKTDYLIGIKAEVSSDGQQIEKETPQHNRSFCNLIEKIEKMTGEYHPALLAIYRFCNNKDQIQYLRNSPYWTEFLNSFVIFEVQGSNTKSVFEIEKINLIWEKYYSALSKTDDTPNVFCLVNGSELPLAKIHPTIKKGIGGKNDIPFVSCNFDAAESYGKKKNTNAYVSIKAASAIAGALNYLIDTRKHNLTIADTKTLFWAEKNDKFAEYFWQYYDPPKDSGFSEELYAFLKSVRSGKLPQDVQDSSRFFILGLTPNAARIAVRFWYVNTVEAIARNMGCHLADLQIQMEHPERNSEYPSIWQLLIETATQHKTENIPPNIVGPLMRSILSGSQYPAHLLSILLNRVRIDQEYWRLNYYRASFIKAILNRNYKKELTMALDPSRIQTPYSLGRLFSILEKVQEESAGGNLNATIKDRYFATASTTPKIVFPLLLRLTQNHFKKLKSEKPGLAVTREKQLGEVMNLINEFPATLKLEDQGEFAIGYYHQRQDFFKRKESDPTST